MEIREVDFGIANNFGDYIELNKNLRNYPKLRRQILDHEFGHTKRKGFTKEDLIHDLSEVKVSNFELLKFMVHNPKSFYQLLPFYYKQGRIYYDINLIIIWMVILGIISFAGILAFVV